MNTGRDHKLSLVADANFTQGGLLEYSNRNERRSGEIRDSELNRVYRNEAGEKQRLVDKDSHVMSCGRRKGGESEISSTKGLLISKPESWLSFGCRGSRKYENRPA